MQIMRSFLPISACSRACLSDTDAVDTVQKGDRDDEPQEQKRAANDLLVKLFWLPGWARPRLVMDLAWRFAHPKTGKPRPLPLGLTAGQAIRIALGITFTKILFNLGITIICAKLTPACPEIASDDKVVQHYDPSVWIIWLPWQVLCVLLEMYMFSFIAIPKVQVVSRKRIPFFCWFLIHIALSTMGSLDTTTDNFFLGSQIGGSKCLHGAIIAERWDSIFRQAYDIMGIHFSYLGACWFAWSLNVLPVMYAIIIGFTPSCSLESRCCVDIDYEVNFEADPDNVMAGNSVELLEDFRDEDGPAVQRKASPWVLTRDTLLDSRRNHGEVLMTLAEVNGFKAIVFDDLLFAKTKANECMRIADSTSNQDEKRRQLDAACSHILSQINRGLAHNYLVGALTNGQQVFVQVTGLAILVNSSHLDFSSFQPCFSLALGIAVLCNRVYSAIEVLCIGFGFTGRLRSLYPDYDQNKIWNLRWRSWCLLVGTVYCCVLIVITIVKLIAISFCPHAVWTVTGGCWKPDEQYNDFCANLQADYSARNMTIVC
jgi:hypothetical protein